MTPAEKANIARSNSEVNNPYRQYDVAPDPVECACKSGLPILWMKYVRGTKRIGYCRQCKPAKK